MGGVKSLTNMYSYNEYLYYYINRGDLAKVEEVLAKKPSLIRDPITPTSKVTALMQAAYNNNTELAQLLITKYEADPNQPSEKGDTPLITAIRRNHLKMVQFLIEKGASPNYIDKAGFKTFEYALLQGLYEICYFLLPRLQDREFKTPEEYHEIGRKYQYRYVNYELFLEELNNGTEPEKTKDYLKKHKVILSDPVIDPRESWGQWFCRNVEFKDPPLVERSELPENLRPENRRFGKISHFFGRLAMTPASQKPEYQPEVRSQMQMEMESKNHVFKDDGDKYETQTVS